MKKRFVSLLLAGALMGSLLPAASAAAPAVSDMAQVLAALDIMTGNEDGDLMLDRPVTRAEFTKLVIAASPRGKNVGVTTTVSPYPDVPSTHWAAPYVEAAVAAGYVNGNVYGYFEPDRSITLQEGVTMAVRLLGYTDSDFSGAWPSGQMALYYKEDLNEGISIGQADIMTRQDAMYLFYNLLTAPTSQGKPYLVALGYSLTATGDIDRVALVNAAMDGPIVVESGWQQKVGFDVNTATVYRNGDLTALSYLQSNDVLYYSPSMRTLWAYSNKVTGLYQSVSPSASAPSSVTVAGKEYSIETISAAYALSNLGSFKTGDTVTLLLGRDGGVAAVVAASKANSSLVGVVSGVSDSSYTDSNGNSYTASTVTLTATDGNTYSYPTSASNSFKAGDLAQVTLTSDGAAKISRLNKSTVSVKISAAGDKVGTTALAEDVEILDANKSGQGLKIYPNRLAGLILDSSDVRYVRKNAAGEIDLLVLDDFTGDLASYGVLTSVTEVDAAGALTGVYVYDIEGVSHAYQLSNGVLNLSVGPVKIEGSLTAPEKISKLKSVRLTSADALTAVTADNTSFPMADQVAVYELDNNTYRLSSLERVRSGFSLTGWYDQNVTDGGRIRVIVAKAK